MRLLATTLALLLYGCDRDLHDHPELSTGKQLFDYHCSGCHREGGKGSFLRGVPPVNDTSLSAYQITHKIRQPDNGEAKMPSFANMSQEEAVKIANYLKLVGITK